jgi:2-polyprenyl-3-methyl-5-hydroxy-6-metoxy-1,4-benzoquinol methylase
VLEVGCGTGTTALHLAPHVGQMLATDASHQMIEIARGKARAAGITNVEFRTGTLDDTSLTLLSYDVVTAFNLFHLLEDVQSAIRRASALLTPGGLLISKTPCLGDRGALLRTAIPVMRWFGKAPFVNFVTKTQLVQALQDAGLGIVEEGLYPANSHSWLIVARKP